MVAAPLVDHLPVGIVQMEEAGELLRSRLSDMAPVRRSCSSVRKLTGMAASQNSLLINDTALFG